MCLRDLVKLTVPHGLRMPFRQLMLATMEPAVREVLHLPHPHPHPLARPIALLAARWG